MTDHFRLDAHWVAGRVILLRLVGDLDTRGAQLVASAWNNVTRSEPASQDPMAVVADLRDLTFIDRTGVRALESINAASRELGARFVLVSPPPAVQRVLEMAGLFSAGHQHDPPGA